MDGRAHKGMDPAGAARRKRLLAHALDHAAHHLPVQGPIGVFIHHNTLHALEHLPFEEAVTEAARLHGTEPYMAEEAYRAEFEKGRIREEDIDEVLRHGPDAGIVPGGPGRRALRRAMLVPGARRLAGRSVRWSIEEEGLAARFRDDLPPEAASALAGDSPEALWRTCVARVPKGPAREVRSPVRPRDAILGSHGVDTDLHVHPPLIRLTGAYLDQGIAYWPMPFREEGLLRAARAIMGRRPAMHPFRLGRVGAMLREQERRVMPAEDVVLEVLGTLGVREEEWEACITAELLALPGWAGLVRRLEQEPALAPHDRVRCSLMEFLALRLTYTVAVTEDVLGHASLWRRTAIPPEAEDLLAPAARLFDAAQLLGLPSRALGALPQEHLRGLFDEVEAFGDVERRRVWHAAYERRHERSVLVPLAKHAALPVPTKGGDGRPAAQVMFCIDEREESIRRALEETDPDILTYSAAGFFGCAINYAGMDDPHSVPLSPVVIEPAHAVHERPVEEHAHLHERRQSRRRTWALVVRNEYLSSRTLLRGWFSTAVLGFLSLVPLALRVLRPLAYARMMDRLNGLFLPEPRTELAFMRDDGASRDATTGLLRGFSVPEMADRVAGVLGPAGMRGDFARIVVILGHGSTSLNNPHESAHDCGACGGRRGGPNARLFAAMANRPAVRGILRAKGIPIPDDTWFVGGYHDTCDDRIDLYDLDLVPRTHGADLDRVARALDKARALDAHERARRFEAAGKGIGPEEALRHVQERAEHLAEPRPEYGHCTNAVCIVGRRERTRGLFLDRRAFLASYDPTTDVDGSALAAVLGAVVPVCAGISLEYYFSFVDNEGYGCGTKLPHNVTGLVGVMNGYQGDIRTGLPLQMVEIHEPVRILFVVEALPEVALRVMMGNPGLKQLLVNRWIRLAVMDPTDGRIEVYRDGIFEPLTGDGVPLPAAASSMAWYAGRMEHLPLARIGPGHSNVAA